MPSKLSKKLLNENVKLLTVIDRRAAGHVAKLRTTTDFAARSRKLDSSIQTSVAYALLGDWLSLVWQPRCPQAV